jgi:hypothetical protein
MALRGTLHLYLEWSTRVIIIRALFRDVHIAVVRHLPTVGLNKHSSIKINDINHLKPSGNYVYHLP